MDTMSSLLQSLNHFVHNSNFVLLLLFCCSVIGAAVFLERILYLRKVDMDTDSFLIQVRKAIEEGNIIDAVQICEKTKGAASNIVKIGLLKHEFSRGVIEQAMELRGQIELAKMEKRARVLSVLAHVTPLIGLLGTVLGFIKAFGEMRLSNLIEISAHQIGGAMEYALITTATGLVIAIPAVIAYNYIVSRIDGMVVELQTCSQEVVDLLVTPAKRV